MNTLIIGGSRGLGWSLAKEFAGLGDNVVVTGRKQPDKKAEHIVFKALDLSKDSFVTDIIKLIESLPTTARLVYAPGFFQNGRITDLSNEEVEEMVRVCGTGLIYTVKAVLEKQDHLDELITITSTSQWAPRQEEPVYNFAKAGAGHFSNALSLDGRIGKVLVAGPAGMKTAFWEGTDKDQTGYNEADWVAKQIIDNLQGDYCYKFIKVLRAPAMVEVAEERS